MPRGKPQKTTVRETAIDLTNSIKIAFEQLLDAVEGQPDAFEAEDVAKIHGFVAFHNDATAERLRRLIARDVRGAGTFDFEMLLPAAPVAPAPAAGVARIIAAEPAALLAAAVPAPSKPRLASAGGAVIAGEGVPVGRMVGSKEVVVAEPERPRPPEPQPSTDDFSDEPGFLKNA